MYEYSQAHRIAGSVWTVHRCAGVSWCFCLTWGFTKLWAFVHDYIIQKLLERLTVTLKDSDSTQRGVGTGALGSWDPCMPLRRSGE